MRILYNQLITNQISLESYHKVIVGEIFLILILAITIIYICFFYNHISISKKIIFALIFVLTIESYGIYYLNKTKSKYKIQLSTFESYNKYIITNDSKIDLKKYKITYESNDYKTIEEIHHKVRQTK